MQSALAGGDGGSAAGEVEIEVEVTREEFEGWCADLFGRCMLPVTRLLGDLGASGSRMY